MASSENTTDRLVPVAFRIRESRRLMLEVIRKRDGHADLSETLRHASDEYLDRHLLRQNKEAA